jgi:hypothetical protein
MRKHFILTFVCLVIFLIPQFAQAHTFDLREISVDRKPTDQQIDVSLLNIIMNMG